MQQPELGRRFIALRQQKNLTQEELVAKSHVSVRTIQRIEACEVVPRLSTLKILLGALGENYESFSAQPTTTPEAMETPTLILPTVNRNILLTAALAGIVYLVCQIAQEVMDAVWLVGHQTWEPWMNSFYTGITVMLTLSFTLFIWGFIKLSVIFENILLKITGYMLIIATIIKSVVDISTLSDARAENALLLYIVFACMFGVLAIIFGIALLRLQDGMGELSYIAGLLEISMGCGLITVILFPVAYVVMIPAVVLEIIILYRGYEYLSRSGA